MRATQLVVPRGLIGGHTVRKHLEEIYHAAAYRRMLELARGDALLDVAASYKLRELIDIPGVYCRAAVCISGLEHRLPHPSQVPGLMADLVVWVAVDGQEYDPVLRAALTHKMLLATPSFADRNKRTGRMGLNLHAPGLSYSTATLQLGAPRAMGRTRDGGVIDMFREACANVPEALQRLIRDGAHRAMDSLRAYATTCQLTTMVFAESLDIGDTNLLFLAIASRPGPTCTHTYYYVDISFSETTHDHDYTHGPVLS